MHSHRTRSPFRFLASTSLLLSAPFPFATIATAQTTTPPENTRHAAPDTNDDQIVVTASRIAHAKVVDQPVTTLTGATIDAMGYTNIGTALTQLPAFGVPANGPVGSQGSFSAGETFVNLFNLGAQRTLTLVNGNRSVSAASSSLFGPVAGDPVDLSQIAPDLVERVEVVTVGGAPIYGSDAIAGTVNVILKKNYEGISGTVSAGISKYGDGRDTNGSLLFGRNFAEGRGNITLNFYYDRQHGISDGQRPDIVGGNSPFTGSARTNSAGYTHQLYSGGKRYGLFTDGGLPLVADSYPILGTSPYASVTDANGNALRFNRNGRLVPFVNGAATGSALYQAGGDGFPIANYDNFLADTERYSATMLAHYDITDHIQIFSEVWWGRSFGTNVSSQPYYSTAIFGNAGELSGNLVFNTSNPFLNAADRATIENALGGPGTFYLARANTDLTTGQFRSRTDILRVVTGLKGDFEAGERKFNWDVTVNYGRSVSATTSRELNLQNFANALDATTDAGGNIVCAGNPVNSPYPTLSSTCAPLDVFGTNTASAASVAYVTSIAQTHQVNTQYDIVADIKGDIIRLPGGFAKFALGYEQRHETAHFDPGAFFYGQVADDGSRTQYGPSTTIDPVGGAFTTHEAFGELSLPLISPSNHVPFVHRLEINGAARYVTNSSTSNFWAYTGGGTYAPVRDITFRGNYTRSFRAPALTELYAPRGTVYDTGNDPCDHRYIQQGPNPALRAANCAAAGLPSNFTSNIVDYTVQGTSGGNAGLQNEIASSWTAGAVIEPHFIPGLQITADYISISIANEIATLGPTDLMDACYDSPGYPNSFCNTFTRDSTGQVIDFAEGNYNIGAENFRALQGAISYDLPLHRVGLPERFGALSFRADFLHTYRHYYQVGTGDLQKVAGGITDPIDNVTATITYNNKHFSWLWQGIYYGPTRLDVNAPDSTYQYPRQSPYLVVNSAMSFIVNQHYTFSVNVNNVFDRGVPFPYSTILNSSNRYYDAIMGRYVRVSVKVKF
ncbi:TonB-dependent receptor [Novosphingobium nitrogenifigens DSM 19370]|uniref:TonB-dependent receptor n=2 Tax=Novosphingobium nitrogenifigens TaxID=378548 RepID=F1ZD00_9SPHN|nr:TonB-dependent receptor [Novosphingobium nitrogenifigens DSM 19370]